ncbi:MAG: hypothetical protein IID40_12565, partial [Planctomycetes bacterium]|nr:hypothetical protein [Planctomycetota bacterium]
MGKQRDYFSLGLWVIVVAVLFVGGLIFIGGRQWGQRYQGYVVRYPATFALPDEIKTGAQIYCGSALVGRVTGVALRRGPGDEGASRLWAYLDVRVDPIVELRSDCSIVARGSLLGGGGRLIITDPGRSGDVLAPGALIDGSPAGTMDAALDALNAEIDPDNNKKSNRRRWPVGSKFNSLSKAVNTVAIGPRSQPKLIDAESPPSRPPASDAAGHSPP